MLSVIFHESPFSCSLVVRHYAQTESYAEVDRHIFKLFVVIAPRYSVRPRNLLRGLHRLRI